MRSFLILSLSLALGYQSWAQSSLEEVKAQAAAFSGALEAQSTQPASSDWVMHVVRIRTVLEFGVEIPLIAEFSINPEVELYFSKRPPKTAAGTLP